MATDPTTEPEEKWGGKGWGWLMAYGVISIIIGVLALIQPLATGLAVGLLLSFLLIISGVTALIAGISGNGWRNRWLDIGLGLVSLVLGIVILFNPFAGAVSLVWLIGCWLLAIGVLEIIAAFRTSSHRGWLIFLGIVDIILGAIVALSGPVFALAFLAVAVGVSLILRGAGLCYVALQVRKLSDV